MRLVVPYANPHLDAETALFAARAGAELVDMTGDAYAYWRLFCELWAGGRFAIVEHDIVPTMEQWHELRDCAAPWCVFEYERLGTITATMGMCAFDPDKLPIVTYAVGPQPTQADRERALLAATLPPRPDVAWNEVDGVVFGFLGQRGYSPHRHGRVRHKRRAE